MKRPVNEIKKYVNFTKEVKPILKEKFSSNFVLIYSTSNELILLEINPGNNYEYEIYNELQVSKLHQNEIKIDSVKTKESFENSLFRKALKKVTLYKISAFKIGFNI